MTKTVQRTFALKDEHIQLITKFYIQEGYAEACPPEVNQKRPWGDSDHLYSMAEILQLLPQTDDPSEDFYDDEQLQYELEELYSELVDALQIVLSCKTFEPGIYEFLSDYDFITDGPGWRRAEVQNV